MQRAVPERLSCLWKLNVEGAKGSSSVKTHHCLLPWPSHSEISSTLTHVVGAKMLWMKT